MHVQYGESIFLHLTAYHWYRYTVWRFYILQQSKKHLGDKLLAKLPAKMHIYVLFGNKYIRYSNNVYTTMLIATSNDHIRSNHGDQHACWSSPTMRLHRVV